MIKAGVRICIQSVFNAPQITAEDGVVYEGVVEAESQIHAIAQLIDEQNIDLPEKAAIVAYVFVESVSEDEQPFIVDIPNAQSTFRERQKKGST